MTVTVEAGKYYRMANGEKAGPAERHSRADCWVLGCWHYNDYGMCGYRGGNGSTHPQYDLIAEWTDEQPVRTVTPEVRALIVAAKRATIILAQHEPYPLAVLHDLLTALRNIEETPNEN